MATRPIFRERAIEAYRRRSERDVVARLTSGPVLACFWILVVVLLGASVAAWSVRVPTYVAADGVMLGGRGAAAVLFVSPPRAHSVRVGQRVHAIIASTTTSVGGTVRRVGSVLLAPAAARRNYGLGAGLVTEPSLPVTVRFASDRAAARDAGTRVTARVQIGSERVLALFPLFGKLMRGGS